MSLQVDEIIVCANFRMVEQMDDQKAIEKVPIISWDASPKDVDEFAMFTYKTLKKLNLIQPIDPAKYPHNFDLHDTDFISMFACRKGPEFENDRTIVYILGFMYWHDTCLLMECQNLKKPITFSLDAPVVAEALVYNYFPYNAILRAGRNLQEHGTPDLKMKEDDYCEFDAASGTWQII